MFMIMVMIMTAPQLSRDSHGRGRGSVYISVLLRDALWYPNFLTRSSCVRSILRRVLL